MAKPRGTLYQVILLKDTAYNTQGQKLNILQVDNDRNIYYYDSFHRWCYLTAKEEGSIWRYEKR